MTRFHVECNCGFRSRTVKWGRTPPDGQCLYLTAQDSISGELQVKQLRADEPPISGIEEDKFVRMRWFAENAEALVREHFGLNAVLVGPSSANAWCPKCRTHSAKSVVHRTTR